MVYYCGIFITLAPRKGVHKNVNIAIIIVMTSDIYRKVVRFFENKNWAYLYQLLSINRVLDNWLIVKQTIL